MKKMLIIFMSVILGVAFMSTNSFASSSKGQKIYLKKLKKSCGFNGGEMSKKHTQAEWKSIYSDLKKDGNNELVNEVITDPNTNKTIIYGDKNFRFNTTMQEYCPGAKSLKDKYVKHVYDFVYDYASDSGNVPSC